MIPEALADGWQVPSFLWLVLEKRNSTGLSLPAQGEKRLGSEVEAADVRRVGISLEVSPWREWPPLLNECAQG